MLVKLGLAIEPLDEELVSEDLLIVEQLHESWRENFHVRMLLDKEKHDSLEQVLDAHLSLLLDQAEEALLVFSPELDRVSLFVENTTK